MQAQSCAGGTALQTASARRHTCVSQELVLAGRPPSAELLLLNAVLLAVLLFGLACAVLDVSAAVQAAFGWTPPASHTSVEPARVATRDRERELIERLQQLMTQDGAYRDATLAVAALAARLGVAEKKLREVINRQLGFKNFSSFRAYKIIFKGIFLCIF